MGAVPFEVLVTLLVQDTFSQVYDGIKFVTFFLLLASRFAWLRQEMGQDGPLLLGIYSVRTLHWTSFQVIAGLMVSCDTLKLQDSGV